MKDSITDLLLPSVFLLIGVQIGMLTFKHIHEPENISHCKYDDEYVSLATKNAYLHGFGAALTNQDRDSVWASISKKYTY